VDYARVKLGEDPAGEKFENRARAHETFDHVLKPYLAYKKATLRPRSYKGIERHLRNYCKPLHGLQLASVRQRNVATLLSALAAASGPTAANHTRASLSAFFAWSMKEGLVETNPTVATNCAAVNGLCDRVPSDDELRDIWQTLPATDYGRIVKLLVLTGCRREEIGGLRWCEVNLDRVLITLPSERTKNGIEHQVPLSAAALAMQPRTPTRLCAFGSKADTSFAPLDCGQLAGV